MSVNSVSTHLRPYYGPLSGSSSQPARSGTFAETRASQVTEAEAARATQDASVSSSEALWGFKTPPGRDSQQSTTAAEDSTSETSGAPSGRSPPGIALYQRVSQYGSNEPSTSALLKSWNDIVHGGQDAESGVAAFAKAVSQNGALGFESRVIDLTA
jgi:hypothetical protein